MLTCHGWVLKSMISDSSIAFASVCGIHCLWWLFDYDLSPTELRAP